MEKERRVLISFGAAALLGLLAGVAAPKPTETEIYEALKRYIVLSTLTQEKRN